ncbi:hypothetical protein GCM10028791_21490 [Echinicola sediminis]
MAKNTLAVLPFVNMSSDPESEYFCDGITEEIINALAQIRGLKVTSRSSSFFFKQKTLPIRDIAQKLRVNIVLEGSIRIAGNIVRITAQLIHAEDDFHFWSETWDRKLENIFEIQDEISLLIADKLREQTGHFEIDDHLVKKQTDSLDAYAYSLKAKYLFNKWNPIDVQASIQLYEKASKLDPEYVETYVGLADAYGFLGTTEVMSREEAWQKAAYYTQKAYQLDTGNAGVQYQMANLAFFTECNFQKALSHTLKSIDLKPNYPESQQFMAFLYTISDDMKKAKQHLQLALSIDPLSQETLFFKAYFDYRNHRYQQALDEVNNCLYHNPKNIPAYILKCYCLLKLIRFKEVLDYLNAMPNDILLPSEKLGITCLTHWLNKDTEKAQQHISQLEEEVENPHSFQAHSYWFLVLVIMGKTDKAFAWLDKAIDMKSSILLLSYTDPLADTLRKAPLFEDYKERLFYSGTILPKPEKKTPLLSHEMAEKYSSKLTQVMQEEEAYLNPGLSLKSLAHQFQLHPNQLSWLLNENIGKNFNEFINHYRLTHFKKLATSPSNSHLSLIGLAYESGFNSKTVFNTFFKKEEGITPKEFVKLNQADR